MRKAGLVLLEALLLVRHKADASVVPDWNAMEAVRLASRDPLVWYCCMLCLCGLFGGVVCVICVGDVHVLVCVLITIHWCYAHTHTIQTYTHHTHTCDTYT